MVNSDRLSNGPIPMDRGACEISTSASGAGGESLSINLIGHSRKSECKLFYKHAFIDFELNKDKIN